MKSRRGFVAPEGGNFPGIQVIYECSGRLGRPLIRSSLPRRTPMDYNHPMWKDIPGHSRIKNLLRDYCVSGRVPHALLFSGTAGLGKTGMAVEFFRAMNCAGSTGDACGTCGSCLKVASKSHPDLVMVNPESRWIKVDDVREVIADIGLKPFEARTKCIVIEPAESLNTESANALLKTLEEPPENTVILLISHRPKLLLPTVLSRCLHIRFHEEEREGMHGDARETLPGSEGERTAERTGTIRSEVLGLLGGSDPALLARKYFDREGWDLLPEVLGVTESVIRDIMVLRHGSDRLVNRELAQVNLRQAGISEIEEILDLVRDMRRGAHENINLRVAATELFIRVGLLARP